MITIRKSDDRGHANHGWLDSRFTFSFAEYHDPAHVHFRSLRVINEDHVAPGKGFGTHPHDNMEIITYVLEGALEHKDSLGTGSIIKPGDAQRMSAGSGIAHSEFNPSRTDTVHLLQIWILPARRGLTPSYEQKSFPESAKRGKLCLLASPDARDGSVTLHQDVSLYVTLLQPGESVTHRLAADRHAWIQVARGSVKLNGEDLQQGDGAAVSGEDKLELTGTEAAEVLLFDLA